MNPDHSGTKATGQSHREIAAGGSTVFRVRFGRFDPAVAFQDFDAIVRLTDGSGKLALSSFTSLTARPESKKKKKAPFYTPMAPALLVALAKWINPF